MLYLLDANILITANRSYYPIKRVPQFWDWLDDHFIQGNIKIPLEIYQEIVEGNDDLVKWIKSKKKNLLLDEEVDRSLLQDITNNGYTSNPNEVDLQKLGMDPFLIAYAAIAPQNRCVVTLEKPSSRRGSNRKIPDICNEFKVHWYDTFYLIDKLDFKTR